MWCLGTQFSGVLGSVRLTVGLNDLRGPFQPKWFYDSMSTLGGTVTWKEWIYSDILGAKDVLLILCTSRGFYFVPALVSSCRLKIYLQFWWSKCILGACFSVQFNPKRIHCFHSLTPPWYKPAGHENCQNHQTYSKSAVLMEQNAAVDAYFGLMTLKGIF